ncbi:unnamed protein product [uncultured bacterium]|nr:unnamed protein product [uncultured bacterium]
MKGPLALALCLFFSVGLHAQDLGRVGEAVPASVETAYQRGLNWLVKNQNSEGTWDSNYGQEPAVVGLAVLAMLARGDDPNFGPFATAIKRGLDHILKNQNQDNGYIGTTMYNHGFATLALAECYGAVQDPRIGPALEKAVGLILTSQNNNPLGAWRYGPESNDADTTVSGAQMVALFAARNAGLAIPEENIRKGLKFYARCQSPDGGIGYTNAGGPNAARSAIGALVFALAKKQKTAAFQGAFRYLRNAEPEASYYHYYLYYAAQAYFHGADESWQSWNAANIKELSTEQLPDGSWDGQFGPTFSTVASLLSLALNYRFLPIYER